MVLVRSFPSFKDVIKRLLVGLLFVPSAKPIMLFYMILFLIVINNAQLNTGAIRNSVLANFNLNSQNII